MDKQDFQEQDFMEILMRLPCWPPTYARLVATIHVFVRDRTRVCSRANNLKY